VGRDDFLSIGAFSVMSRLSTPALRHCDEVGLLKSAEIDPSSGYRWPAGVPLRIIWFVAERRVLPTEHPWAAANPDRGAKANFGRLVDDPERSTTPHSPLALPVRLRGLSVLWAPAFRRRGGELRQRSGRSTECDSVSMRA